MVRSCTPGTPAGRTARRAREAVWRCPRERAEPLSEALGLWRETRAGGLAQAIDALGDAALAGWSPPAPRTNQAFHAAWLQAVADEVLRGWAARTLLHQLPGGAADARARACCERLAALRGAPAYPRIGCAVVELVGQKLQIARHAGVRDAIVAALAMHGDERTAAIARRRRQTADPRDAPWIDRVLAAHPAAARAATAGELDRFADRAPPPAVHAQLEALFAEALARPDSDDGRLVLADALLALGDPRGELIALQLAARPEARQLDRIDQLLREHGKRWLGPLREVAYRARFVRGFLTRLELDGRWTATDEGWARHALDPALATVEDLIPGRAVGEIYARFVASPAMAALRRIEVFDAPTLGALHETAASLVHVACPRWKHGRYLHELSAHVLPACARFAQLRSFAVHLDGVDAVLRAPLVDQLTALTVAGGLVRGLALWPRLPRAITLAITRSARLEDCAMTRGAWAGALTLAHDGEHAIARGTGGGIIGELLEHFAALPAAVRRLEIEGAGAHAEGLTRAAARRGIELLLLPPARRTGYVAGLDR